MMGMKYAVASNMIHSVRRLDDASHTVSPKRGSADEGIRNGNSASPTVRITPLTANDEMMNIRPSRQRPSSAATSRAPPTPRAGATQASGHLPKLASPPPGRRAPALLPGSAGGRGLGRLVLRGP